jgi:hypothetical protein
VYDRKVAVERPSRAFMAVAGVALLIALIDAGRTAVFLRRATRVQGTVVSASRSIGSLGRNARTALRRDIIVSYPAGQQLQTRHRADFFERFEDGQSVMMAYDPDHPQRSRICTPWQLWGDAIEFMLIAAAAGLLAFTNAVEAVRRRLES